MAISDNYAPVKTIGDGATVDFSYGWDVGIANYIVVNLQEIATGDLTLQVLGSDFTLEFDDVGGIVTFLIAPTDLNNVIISRDTTKDQSDRYSTAKGFQGVVQENSFDKLTNITQEICYNLEQLEDDVENITLEIDGGFANSIYLTEQLINGGSADGI